jgi:hypothetical protein
MTGSCEQTIVDCFTFEKSYLIEKLVYSVVHGTHNSAVVQANGNVICMLKKSYDQVCTKCTSVLNKPT